MTLIVIPASACRRSPVCAVQGTTNKPCAQATSHAGAPAAKDAVKIGTSMWEY